MPKFTNSFEERFMDHRYNAENTLLMVIAGLTKGTQQEEIGKEFCEKARAIFDYYADEKQWK